MVPITGTTSKCARQPLGLTAIHSIKHQVRKNTIPFLKAGEKPPTRPLHSPRLATVSWPWKTIEGLQSHKHIIQTRLHLDLIILSDFTKQRTVWITWRKPVRESLQDLRSWWSSAETCRRAQQESIGVGCLALLQNCVGALINRRYKVRDRWVDVERSENPWWTQERQWASIPAYP